MSTLDRNFFKNQAKRYLYFSIFLIIFAFIYESFSHGVYSYYLILSFLFPLIFGFVISFIIYLNKLTKPIPMINYLYNISIITITIGSIVKGILDIYGTTNHLLFIYFIIGIPLLIISIILYIIKY